MLVVAGAICSCGRIGFDGTGSSADGRFDDAPLGDGNSNNLTSPIASWSFDDSGQTIADTSGGWNGFLGATSAVESSDPQRDATANRVCTGVGLRFDGANDVVTIPGPSAANLSAF